MTNVSNVPRVQGFICCIKMKEVIESIEEKFLEISSQCDMSLALFYEVLKFGQQ